MKRSEIAEEIIEVIGLEAATKFFRHYGGKEVKIPWGAHSEGTFINHLVELLGEEAYRRLVTRFGGNRIYLPKDTTKALSLSTRNRQIVADYCAGKSSMLELVRRYNLCERQIRTILNRPTE